MHDDMWKAQTRYLHVAIMCATAVFCYSPVAQCVQCVLELPEGVALEIEACDVVRGVKQGYARDLCRAVSRPALTHKPLLAPWKALHLPLVPCFSN